MSTVTIPWIERGIRTRGHLRGKAIRLLLLAGVGLLAVAGGVWMFLDRVPSAATALAFGALVVLPALGGLGLIPLGLIEHHPVKLVGGVAHLGVAAVMGGLLRMTPIDPFVVCVIALVIGLALAGAAARRAVAICSSGRSAGCCN
ncbi:MAG: hypothetical protein U1A27_09025 [Phycisphaerae bacterium]